MTPVVELPRRPLLALAACLALLAVTGEAQAATGFGYGDPRSTDLKPFTVEATADGGFLMTRRSPGLVLRYAAGKLRRIAGGGRKTPRDGTQPATSVSLFPIDAIEDPRGGVLLSDFFYGRVARVRGGRITFLAGGGKDGNSNEVPASQAELSPSQGLGLASDGSIIFDDFAGIGRVLSLSPGGTITTIAGGTFPSTEDDGVPARTAYLSGLFDLSVEPDDSVLLAVGNRVRRVGPDGIITTVAGAREGGFSGDGGPAAAARFDGITSIDRASDGSLLVADAGNGRIRRIDPSGTVTTIAGTGAEGFSADGTLARNASIGPYSVSAGPHGNVLFLDGERIRRIDADGRLRTLAGMPRSSWCRDNPYNGIQGTDGADSLRGTSKRDLIRGEAGRDVLRGKREADCLMAGAGGGKLIGGPGSDVLVIGDDKSKIESNALLGSAGADFLFSGSGDDVLDGGPGKDKLDGYRGNDLMIGGAGNDRINGRNDRGEPDRIRCGAGGDVAYIGKGDRAERSTCERVERFDP